jgi:uncharacterized membrane protein
MPNRSGLLTGVGVGVGLVYFLDPQRGGRRRALVRDAAVKTIHVAGDAAGTTTRDVRHRIVGTAAELRRRVAQEDVDDHTVVERVRSKIGRVVSHPHAIDVTVSDGIATLSGPILQAEVSRLLQTVERVRGVREVISQLEEHKQADNVPSLQGGAARPPGLRPDILQQQWAPATRLIVASGGVALLAVGAQRRDLPGWLLMIGGLGLLARGATNLESKRLVGIGARRRAVDLQKAITIDAAVEDVYAFWAAYENFPRFMSRVLEVRPSTRTGQSHWTVAGPAGAPIEFDAEVTQAIPNQVLAWRTVEGSTVGHAGFVRFEPARDGRTRVHIRMSYNPPGGWLGHGLAKAFGVDPKSSLDADLVRMKTLIETGRPPHDAAQKSTAGSTPML